MAKQQQPSHSTMDQMISQLLTQFRYSLGFNGTPVLDKKENLIKMLHNQTQYILVYKVVKFFLSLTYSESSDFNI